MVPKKILFAAVLVLIPVLIVVGIWTALSGYGGKEETPVSAVEFERRMKEREKRIAAEERKERAAAAEDLCDRLSKAKDPQEARTALKALRAALDSMEAEEATAWVGDYLASGQDAELAMEFEIGEGGQLDTAPTLRTALLDHLAVVNPEAAAKLGREILGSPSSADEWALALRNVARVESDEASREFLRGKTEELIRQEAWQAEPSVGYLNAFDVLVHTRATGSTPLLSELVQRKDRKDLAHAGSLTLDRLVQVEPVEVLKQLAEDQVLQQSRPEMVAQQFARADIRDPVQQAVVRDWLLHYSRSANELEAFALTFPNGNQMISRNLLTTQATFEGSDLRDRDRDRRSLEIVESWLANPEFETIQRFLEMMDRRLRTFVEQGVER